ITQHLAEHPIDKLDATVRIVPRNASICLVRNRTEALSRLIERFLGTFLLGNINQGCNPTDNFPVLIFVRYINAVQKTHTLLSKWHLCFVNNGLASQNAFYVWPNRCQSFLAHDFDE